MKKKGEVIIYTSALCGFCYKAKSLLKKKNIFFHEINIDINHDKREEMILKSKGKTTVPQIFFGDFHVGGCDDLFQLEKDNDLRNFS